MWNDRRGWLRDIVLLVALIVTDMKPTYTAIGAVLFVLGCGLHFWSKGTLVRNWMVTTSGPYNIVRHPFYLANFLIDMGICFFSGNIYLIAAYVPAYLLTYIPTIRKEEQFLREQHGTAYDEYAARVSMLVPSRINSIHPLDFSWENIEREHEMVRLMRILAIPLYFSLVELVFHTSPAWRWRVPCIVLAVIGAIALNVGSVLVKRSARRAIWSDLP
jgi:hypothetical protein